MTTYRLPFRPFAAAPPRRVAVALATLLAILLAADGRAQDAGADDAETASETDAAAPIELIDPNSRVRLESHCQPDRVYRQPASEIERLQIEGDEPAAATESSVEAH